MEAAAKPRQEPFFGGRGHPGLNDRVRTYDLRFEEDGKQLRLFALLKQELTAALSAQLENLILPAAVATPLRPVSE